MICTMVNQLTKNATIEEYNNIYEIGEVMAQSLVKFFESEQTRDLIDRLKEAGVNTESEKENVIDNRFEVIKRYTGEPLEVFRHIQYDDSKAVLKAANDYLKNV